MTTRRPRLDAVITAAQKAGVEIARVEVRPDGTICIFTPAGDTMPDPIAAWENKRNGHGAASRRS